MMRPLELDEGQIDDLVAFLESLTGDNIDELIRDARSEHVGNPDDAPRGDLSSSVSSH
jgi:cytochrome c peroxidase